MKHLSSVLLAVAVVAAGVTACFSDPTSSLRNGPNRIELSRSAIFVNVGDSLPVQAEVKDAQGNTYTAASAAWTTGDATIAVVHVSTLPVPGQAYSLASIVTLAPGKTYVTVAASGLKDSIEVVGVPLNFAGVFTTPAGLMMGDTISIAATSVVGFVAGTTVSIDGNPAWVVSQTATTLKVFPLRPAATGAVTFGDLLFLGSISLPLNAAANHPVAATVRANAFQPATQTFATAPTITIPAAATAAAPYRWFGQINGADATNWINYWTFTAPGGKKLGVVLNFYGSGSGGPSGGYGTDPANPDLDVVVCTAVTCAAATSYSSGDLLGFAAAGSSQPESGTTAVLAAGTYYLAVIAGTQPLLTYRLDLSWQ